jgi:hypothetical protein
VAVDFLLLLVVAITYMARSSGGGLACIGDCSWPALVIVRGLVPSPAESQKVTLVDCSCH